MIIRRAGMPYELELSSRQASHAQTIPRARWNSASRRDSKCMIEAQDASLARIETSIVVDKLGSTASAFMAPRATCADSKCCTMSKPTFDMCGKRFAKFSMMA